MLAWDRSLLQCCGKYTLVFLDSRLLALALAVNAGVLSSSIGTLQDFGFHSDFAEHPVVGTFWILLGLVLVLFAWAWKRLSGMAKSFSRPWGDLCSHPLWTVISAVGSGFAPGRAHDGPPGPIVHNRAE